MIGEPPRQTADHRLEPPGLPVKPLQPPTKPNVAGGPFELAVHSLRIGDGAVAVGDDEAIVSRIDLEKGELSSDFDGIRVYYLSFADWARDESCPIVRD